jgi:hypothetical protein
MVEMWTLAYGWPLASTGTICQRQANDRARLGQRLLANAPQAEGVTV